MSKTTIHLADTIKRLIGVGEGEWTSKGDYCPDDAYLDAWGADEELAFWAQVEPAGGIQRIAGLTKVYSGRIDWRPILVGYTGKVVYVNGWLRRGAPVMNPKANLWHWDASKANAKNPAPLVNLVTVGRSDVSGPLCHIYIGYDGTIYVIASGRANHAGMGHAALLQTRIVKGLAPVNSAAKLGHKDTGGFGGSLVGYEIANTVGVPLSTAQLVAIGFLGRATRRHLGFNLAQSSQWGHIHTTRRKIDLDPFKMGQILSASR